MWGRTDPTRDDLMEEVVVPTYVGENRSDEG